MVPTITATPLKNKALLTDHGANDSSHSTEEQSFIHRSWCQRLEPPHERTKLCSLIMVPTITATPLKNKVLLTDHVANDSSHSTDEQSFNHRSWCQRLDPPHQKEQSFIHRSWCQRLEPPHERTKLYSLIMLPTIRATPLMNKAIITGHGAKH